jgi:hypothetical protein
VDHGVAAQAPARPGAGEELLRERVGAVASSCISGVGAKVPARWTVNEWTSASTIRCRKLTNASQPSLVLLRLLGLGDEPAQAVVAQRAEQVLLPA